jgi:hypothetical protein
MSQTIAADTYRNAGLKGVAELYQQFPSRLRARIVNAHAKLWHEFWEELSSEEQAVVDEYVLEGDPPTYSEEIPIYEARLQELQTLYPQRHSQRVKEALTCPPETAVEDIQSFERAHQTLVAITQDLLDQAKSRVAEQKLREEEAGQFSSV